MEDLRDEKTLQIKQKGFDAKDSNLLGKYLLLNPSTPSVLTHVSF